MIYFKTKNITSVNSELIEKSIRKVSLKRVIHLDFKSTTNHYGENKLFLGYESNDAFHISRLRFLFERILPKVIIRFDKLTGFTEYKIRVSLFSSILFLFLLFDTLINIYNSIKSGNLENIFGIVSLLFGLYIILIAIEIKLTERIINKTIRPDKVN